MVLPDPQDLRFITGIRNDKVIAPIGQPQVEPAVFFGYGPESRILTEDRGIVQSLTAGGIEDHSIDRECLFLRKTRDRKTERKEKQKRPVHGISF